MTRTFCRPFFLAAAAIHLPASFSLNSYSWQTHNHGSRWYRAVIHPRNSVRLSCGEAAGQ
jgi:hypothetical protein